MGSKVWTIVGTLLLVGTISYGQNSSENASKAICKCIEEKVPAIDEKFHLKDSVKACLARGMAMDMDGLRKDYRMRRNGITVEQVREIRDRLWRRLEKDCGKFKKVVAEL